MTADQHLGALCSLWPSMCLTDEQLAHYVLLLLEGCLGSIYLLLLCTRLQRLHRPFAAMLVIHNL